MPKSELFLWKNWKI